MGTITRASATAILLSILSLGTATAQDMQSTASITVERVIVDARVTDADGEPITGLGTKDFKVFIDGKAAMVESVDWIAESIAARDQAQEEKPQEAEVNTSMDIPAPQGRLLVFLYQTDFGRAKERIGGQMKALAMADSMLDTIEPGDRVAVLSFDSHLKFRLDFTDDKEKVRHAMEQSLRIDEPATPPIVPSPSIAARLNPKEMRDAATPERALLLIANALMPIPGPKSLVLFGWGLGEFVGGGVHVLPDYGPASSALQTARTAVFSLDITLAEGHTLEGMLAKVSGETGGFYAKLNQFPQIAFSRLQKSLAGHYEIEVRKPALKTQGYHSIEVQSMRRGAKVLARSGFNDH